MSRRLSGCPTELPWPAYGSQILVQSPPKQSYGGHMSTMLSAFGPPCREPILSGGGICKFEYVRHARARASTLVLALTLPTKHYELAHACDNNHSAAQRVQTVARASLACVLRHLFDTALLFSPHSGTVARLSLLGLLIQGGFRYGCPPVVLKAVLPQSCTACCPEHVVSHDASHSFLKSTSNNPLVG